MESEDDLFYSIYKTYYPVLVLRARKVGIKKEDVEDIVQDTFTDFYRKYRHRLDEISHRAMLYRILRNNCTDYFRSSGFNRLSYLEPNILQAEGWLHGQVTSESSLEILVEQEEYKTIWTAFESMRDDWKEIFQLHFIQDRSIVEVSEIMGLAPTACRMRISRGRKYLKDILKKKEQP